MTVGHFTIGCDIVDIHRIKGAAERHSRFLTRVFSADEIRECLEKANPWPSFAARFAAKEAVIKAMPGDFIPRLTEIEIVKDELGKPYIHFSGTTFDYIVKTGWNGWSVSLSHEKSHAMATVIAWRQNTEGDTECD